MARGFGATLGVGSTDRLVSNIAPIAGARTIFIVSKRNGNGGGNFGRYWDAQRATPAASQDQLFYSSAEGKLFYQRHMGTVTAQWTVTAPSSGVWHTVGVSFDGSSLSNDPVIYLDGTSATVTEATAPNGSASAASGNGYWVGNRPSDSARVWDGEHAEFAIWNSILTAGQHADLASGVDPSTIDSGNLVLYVPLVSTLTATVGNNLTATGTAVTSHPPGFSGAGGGGSAAARAMFFANIRRRA